MSDGAMCACLGVEYQPVHNLDGTLSERWTCPSCGGAFKRVQRYVPETILPPSGAPRRDPDRDMVLLGAGGLVLVVGGVAGLVVGGMPGSLIPVAFGAFLVVLSHATILGRLRACREIIELAGRVAP